MARTSHADLVTHFENLTTSVAANKDDLAHLQDLGTQLAVETAGAKAALVRQSTQRAEAQQTTQDLQGFIARGKDLATRLRTGVRSKYGNRSEKLTEFEVRPLRKRKAPTTKAKTAEAPPNLEEEKMTPPAATTTEKP
jgi:hypothetical protein